MQPRMFSVLWLIFVLFARHAMAMGPTYWIGTENSQVYLYKRYHSQVTKAPIRPLDPHRKYFHWSDPASAERWKHLHGIDESEFRYLRSRGDGQAAGGGFYVSEDPFNSSDFGSAQVGVAIHPGATVVVASQTFFLPTARMQEVADLLEGLGIDAWEYNIPRHWINLLRRSSIREIGEPTAAEIASEITEVPDLSIGTVLLLHSRYDFARNAELFRKAFPTCVRLATGEPLNAEDLQRIRRWFNDANLADEWLKGTPPSEDDPFLRRLKEEFRNQALAQIGRISAANYRTFRLFLKSSELPSIPSIRFTRNFQSIVVSDAGGTSPQNEFGKNYLESFEFIDLADLLVAQSQDHGLPWVLYDTTGSLLDRWHEMKSRYVLGAQNQKFDPYPFLKSTDELTQLNRLLSGNPEAQVRGKPVIAGGDHWIDGKGYYRVSLKDLPALQSNPYLTVEVVPDPDPAFHDRSALVRHEYPSARTYERFREKLSRNLLQRLDAAKAAGQLASVDSKEFQSLTREILKELWKNACPHITRPAEWYLAMIAIHPFEDYNGRTARALYQILSKGSPLILRSWDWDLLMTPAQLQWEATQGTLFLQALKQDLARIERENPAFPKFYSSTVPSAYFFDSGDRARVFSPKLKDQFLAEAMKFFSHPDTRNSIRQKRLMEMGSLQESDCNAILSGKLIRE